MAGNLHTRYNDFKLDSAKSLVGTGGNCSGCFSEWCSWGGSAETTKARGMRQKTDKLFTKRWRPYFTVAIEVRGGFKPDVLPLVEYIVRRNSDSSGAWMDGTGLWDAEWYRDGRRTARTIYKRLESLFRSVRFSYVKLRLLHYHTESEAPKVLSAYSRGKLKLVKRKRAA